MQFLYLYLSLPVSFLDRSKLGMASLLSCLLFFICISSSALCRELAVVDDSSAQASSNIRAAEWKYDRYTRHGRQEPEEVERYFEGEEAHYGGYHLRPYYEPEGRRYIEGEKDEAYYHGGQQEELEEYEDMTYEHEGQKKGYLGKEDEQDYWRWQPEARHERYHHKHEPERFVLDESSFIQKTIMSTEAGEMTVILPRDPENEFARRMIALSTLTLEPMALLLPHSTNTRCLFVVYKGRGRISWVNGENLHEVDLQEGDVYKVESGTVFYLINTEGERMDLFGIHDIAPGSFTTEQLQFHSFFVAGGWNLGTVLSGFDDDVLAASFNVSVDEAYDVLGSQLGKSIIYRTERNESKQEHPSTKTEGEASERKKASTAEPRLAASSNSSKSEKQASAEVSNLLSLGKREEPRDAAVQPGLSTHPRVVENAKKHSPLKPLNILQKKPVFSNDYGATTVADEKDFGILKDVNKGVFSVRLKPGAILAPHWNPKAMEIALVTEGEGEIQIVYPDGRDVFTGWLTKGSIFYVPQNFVMCHIASRDNELEFIGFSTSSRPNKRQFLAGQNSVLKKINPRLLASLFNIPVEHLQSFIEKQHEVVILPGHEVTKKCICKAS